MCIMEFCSENYSHVSPKMVGYFLTMLVVVLAMWYIKITNRGRGRLYELAKKIPGPSLRAPHLPFIGLAYYFLGCNTTGEYTYIQYTELKLPKNYVFLFW